MSPRPVSPPSRPLPAGAWETHAHVFGPFDRFPLAEGRRYTPPVATAADYFAMLDTTGFTSGVLVHGSANGYDNATTAAATSASKGRARGIGVVAPDATLQQLRPLAQAGLRGLRFTEPVADAPRAVGVLTLADLDQMAPQLQALGWHAQVWTRCDIVMRDPRRFHRAGVPIVFDHMACPEVSAGVNGAVFQSFLAFLKSGPFHVKLTPGRVSGTFPHYEDVRPFHDALLEAIPERLFFGSDWPYLGMDAQMPDVGRMIDLFDHWTPDEALRQAVFVTNPNRFYGR